MDKVEVKHFHLFCGLGGGAKGFNQGHARVGNCEAVFRCIGGIDNDPASIADFNRAADAKGTVMDLFSREQYLAFHGHEPPSDWRESTPADVLKAAGNEHPNIVFLSAPCKGFSGLLSQKKSLSGKYQALNNLTVRGIWLMLDAFRDDLPELIIFENVPRIANRGRPLLDQIVALLQKYGYAVAETTHDCGELGGLAQSRRRFLLVARNQDKVPAFLYEPTKKPLRAVGDILGDMLLPGDPAAGPMHRIPRLQWKTWVRLAFVEAGKDWRSLNRLAVEHGYLRDYLIVPEYHRGYLGVNHWDESAGTVAGGNRATNGKFSVADPRPPAGAGDYHQYGVNPWDEPMGTITGQRSPGQGTFSVADPRPPQRDNYNVRKYRITGWNEPAGTTIAASTTGEGAFAVQDPRHQGCPKHSNEFRIVPFESPCQAVTSAHGSGQCIADPRYESFGNHAGKMRVEDWEGPAHTITGSDRVGSGALSVADPRPGLNRGKGDHYLTGGHYGVVPWGGHSYAVAGFAKHDRGHWSVADPRLPAATDKLVAVIRSLDGTWHRPFTTLELAALQGLVTPGEHLELDGANDGAWRERIGNAVPAPAAAAIASMMGETILLARLGETFMLSSTPVWVRPVAIALSVQQGTL